MARSAFLRSFIFYSLFLISCGNKTQTTSVSDSLFDVSVHNTSADSLIKYPFEVDLVRVNDQFVLRHGEETIPVQIEDRNANDTPDKMFAMVDLAPGSLKKITAIATSENETSAQVRMHAQINGKKAGQSYLYDPEDLWDEQGVILENEWIGFRYLMKPPFAFDIIGKKTPDLLSDNQLSTLTQKANWGGDALEENNSLGVGSPAIYDQDKIVQLTVFDSKEVNFIVDGPLRAEVQITIKGVPVRDEKLDFMLRWQMMSGKPWSELEVSILTRTDLNLQVACGLPKHPDATDFTQGLISHTHFAYTYGLQDSGGEHLGLAIMVPGQYEIDTYREDPDNYFYLVTPQDRKVSYRMMASWGKGRKLIIDEVDFIGEIKKACAEYGAVVQIKPDFRL